METCCCTNHNPKPLQLKVLPTEPRFGCHVGLRDSLLATLTQPSVQSCRCLQLYLGNNQSYSCRSLSPHDTRETAEYCSLHDRTFYIHAPLVTFSNLSRADVVEKSKTILTRELNEINGLPGACVTHIGKVGTIEGVATALNEISIPRGTGRCPRSLLVESAAGQGTELGKTWDDLRHLFEALDTNKIGLCLDTQHIFASGMSDLYSHESIVKLFDQAKEVCPSGISLIHLNDSKKPFGSRVDRHENLREGYIWSQSDKGLRALMLRCFEDAVDIILETPDPSKDLTRISTNYL